MRSPTLALFTPTKGRSSLGLLSCMRAFDSPCGSSPAPLHVRSSEFQRSGSMTRVTEPPSVGFLSPPPSLLEARAFDSPWTRPTSPPAATSARRPTDAQAPFRLSPCDSRFTPFGSATSRLLDRFSTSHASLWITGPPARYLSQLYGTTNDPESMRHVSASPSAPSGADP